MTLEMIGWGLIILGIVGGTGLLIDSVIRATKRDH